MPNLDLRYAYLSVYPAYPANLTNNNGSSYTNTQAYINERLGFFKNRLYVTGGVTNYATVTKSWNELTHSTPSVLDDNKFMYTESVLWKVLDNVSLYYSHSNNASPVIANNLPLWRSGVQDEAGVKSEFFDHRLSLDAAWFKISQTNVTVPNPAYQTDPTQPQQLISDLSNHGLEFELMGAITPRLSAIATYSYLNMRDALGRHVRGVADNIGAVLLNYRFDDGDLKGLAVNFGVTYSGRRAGDVPSTNYTPLRVVTKTSFFLKPSYQTTLGFRYNWQDKIIYRLTIDNVLDNQGYIVVAGGRVSGTGLTTQPGTNVKFSTTFQF
jgi:iron complex outermembrane recepter protein